MVLSWPFRFPEFDWFGIIGFRVARPLLALFWNWFVFAAANVGRALDIIWFIGTLFLLLEIGSKSLRKLLLFKFNGVDGAAALNGVCIGLFVGICDGKLGDGVIVDDGFTVVDNVDDKSLDFIIFIFNDVLVSVAQLNKFYVLDLCGWFWWSNCGHTHGRWHHYLIHCFCCSSCGLGTIAAIQTRWFEIIQIEFGEWFCHCIGHSTKIDTIS